MPHESISSMPLATPEAGQSVAAPSIAEAAAQLEHDPNSELQKVAVWDVGALDVEQGKIGAITTSGLNGCHVSVLTGKDPNGKRTLAMTHFPPGLAADRYKRSITELSTIMKAQGIEVDQVVTLADSRRNPSETTVLTECFPDAMKAELTYDSRASGRSESEDAGKVLAVLDYRDSNGPQLHMATESGTASLPLAA